MGGAAHTSRQHALAPDHPTATVFLDETGVVHRQQERYFGIGCLKAQDPAQVMRDMRRLRDRFGF